MCFPFGRVDIQKNLLILLTLPPGLRERVHNGFLVLAIRTLFLTIIFQGAHLSKVHRKIGQAIRIPGQLNFLQGDFIKEENEQLDALFDGDKFPDLFLKIRCQ